LTIPPVVPDVPPPFLDVTGDNSLAPLDALQVINYLNTQAGETAAWSLVASSNWLDTDLDRGPALVVPESSTLVLASPAACLLLWLRVKRVLARVYLAARSRH